MNAPDFWENRETAERIIQEVTLHKRWVEAWQRLEDQRSDLMVLYELSVEEDDGEAMAEIVLDRLVDSYHAR